MRGIAVGALQVFELLVFAYFVVINSLYILFAGVAFVELRKHRRKWTGRELASVMRSPATPAVSVIMPAYNEASTIGESIRSLLHLNFPQFEVVVVNDGSTDGTLSAAIDAFELVRAPVSHQRHLNSQPVRAVYRSLTNRDIVVIDKENGGKADAINAGINAARYPLVCVIDADSLLEDHALTRAVLPFLEDPTTVAAGGIIRIANGCKVEHGRVTTIGLPASSLARFQVVEYLRAFLAGRVAQSVVNGLLIVSGAFGVFRRDLLIEAGGFRQDTIGEDMEIVTRLHRLCRERGKPYRIVFQPDPVCWTEAPETVRGLARQRNRWQRGTMQVLGFHAPLMFNPRYGVIGLFALPYYLVFEAVGPLIEFSGYVLTVLALLFGVLDWRFAEIVFLAAVLYGAVISLLAIILEEVSFRRYPRATDLLTLAAYGVLENFGYRQLATWWRITGIFDFFRGRQGWGKMTRKGFSGA
jgi:cellulose synthase/poly-beta-1,6-N-acetylglucosamine synthase-like glycosyltransferase